MEFNEKCSQPLISRKGWEQVIDCIQRTDTDMTNGIVIFLVDIFKRAEVFQRAADGFGEVLLAHEHPEALHAALCACLHLDGKDVHVLDGEVVDFGQRVFCLACPIEHFMTKMGRLVMEQFKPGNEFCHGTLVDQISSRSGKDMGGKGGTVGHGHVQKSKGEGAVQGEDLPVRCVCPTTQGQAVGTGMGDRDKQTGKDEKIERTLHFGCLVVAYLGIYKLAGSLFGGRAQGVAKKSGIDSLLVLWEVIFIAHKDVVLYLLTGKIVVGGYPLGYTFGHSANQHIGTKQSYQLLMKSYGERSGRSGGIAGFEQQTLAIGKEELVEGHGVHEHGMYAAYTESGQLCEGKLQQGACGNDMQIGQVLFEETERHDSFGAFLYLVDKEKCASWLYTFLCQGGDFGDDAVDVEVGQKGCLILRFTFEVYLYITFKLLTEMSYGGRFTDLSGPTEQDWLVDAA